MKKNLVSLILLLVFVQVTAFSFAQSVSKPFTLDDLMKNRLFASASVDGLKSMNDGVHYTTISDDYRKLEKYSYKTGEKVATLLSLDDFPDSKIKMIVDYEFSADESRLLIQSDYEPLYRRSFKADYYIYDMAARSFTPLSTNGKQQLATFSPDGMKLAFVRENNLFIADPAKGTELKITNDGKFNEIINGAPDWVYEEEFEFNKAFTWSADSKKLAWIKFDERGVKMFNMTLFQGQKPAMDENSLYPANSQFKYPKAGEDNSIVSVHIYNLDSGITLPADIGSETDLYIPRIMFTEDPSILAILRLNRLQNRLEILKTNAGTGASEVLYTEENKCYIDESNFDNLRFLPDGKHFIITSERDGWNHLYLYNNQGVMVKQLTSGNFDVTGFYGFDPGKNVFYYQAAGVSPLQREVYSVTMDGKVKTIAATKGTNGADFSKTFRYYINIWSSVTSPA
ncbi:MAG: S9 family peptidase, partial [Lentimicrobium sp.]|nr:S9 family peptidase [Lentimicrobium sp.]